MTKGGSQYQILKFVEEFNCVLSTILCFSLSSGIHQMNDLTAPPPVSVLTLRLYQSRNVNAVLGACHPRSQ